MSYGYRKLDRLLNQDFWAELTFLYKSGFWQNFAMTFPEILNTKIADNELRFLLVTHTTRFDIRFGCYGLLKSGYGAELFWTAWILE